MNNIEKQLVDLQHQIERLTEKVAHLIENSSANERLLNWQRGKRQNRSSVPEGFEDNQQKGINRFRAINPRTSTVFTS